MTRRPPRSPLFPHTTPFRSVPPAVGVSISSSDVNVAASPATVSFVFSEAPTDFTLAGDTTASGGTLSALASSDATHYTATFTAAPGTDITTAKVAVTGASWHEDHGNAGTGGDNIGRAHDCTPVTLAARMTSTAF